MNQEKPFRILCLDGGGSKGMYTLGVLSELEKHLKSELYNHFDLIFGTSTGAIITAMIGLGYSVPKITAKYKELIPKIMRANGQARKSHELKVHGKSIFAELGFESFKTGVGIVAMNFDTQRPLVFKNNVDRAHGAVSSFEPGFGTTILDAIEASAAACPIFSKKVLETTNKGKITAIDGGFVANNPCLFALIDAIKALKIPIENIRMLSVGVGSYIEKPMSAKWRLISRLEMAQIASKVLVASSNTNEVLTRLLFPELNIVRVNDSFNNPDYKTNMTEHNIDKLNTMFQLGVGSYGSHEPKILELLK